jgi:hypothetical protein
MTDPGAILGVDDDPKKLSDQVLFAVPQIIAPKPIHAAVTVAQFVMARGIHDILFLAYLYLFNKLSDALHSICQGP